MNQYVGIYELVSFEQKGPNGLLIRSAPDATGTLIYTPTGEVSLNMHRRIQENDPEILRNWIAHLHYSGRYTVKEPNQIIHTIVTAFPVSLMGSEQVREAKWDAENETLRLNVRSRENEVIASMSWKRRSSWN